MRDTFSGRISILAHGLGLLFCLVLQLGVGQTQIDLEEVYSRLKTSTGEDLAWPDLRVLNVPDRIASYSPRKNIIWIDAKAVKICQSMGDASQDAMAFLLAHEISHFLERSDSANYGFTSGFEMARMTNEDLRHSEEMADSRGSFLARQAGYASAAVVDSLLKRLYGDYNLSGGESSHYPALTSRVEIAKDAVELSKTTYDMYRSAVYLMCLGDHATAIALFETVYDWISFTELEYNLGICYLHRYFDHFPTGLKFPLSSESGIPMVRSQNDLSPMELLQKARQHFSQVENRLQSDLGLTQMSLLLIDLVIDRDQDHTVEQARLSLDSKNPLEVCFAANILALLGREAEALDAYEALLDHGEMHIQIIATDNLKRIDNLPLPSKINTQSKRSFVSSRWRIGDINWQDEKQAGRVGFRRGTNKSSELAVEVQNPLGRRTRFLFENETEATEPFALVTDLPELKKGDFDITYHTAGYFVVSHSEGMIYKFDHSNQLINATHFQCNP